MAKISNAIGTLQSSMILIFLFLLGGPWAPDLVAAPSDESSKSPVIIVGFVGGLVRHDDLVHDEVRLAARLRKEHPTGVVVETFENRYGENAHQRILNLLDTNHKGKLSAEEKHRARIILYGHSWGASEVVNVARRLEKDGIAVLLTIQVDSVPKFGQTGDVIPANVAQAANFYEADGLVHGISEIRAADATRTHIIGNFRFNYADVPYACAEYPWYSHLFMKAHTQIECDPKVWRWVETLIRSAMASQTTNESNQDGDRP